MESRKEALIKALQSERDLFIKRGQSTKEHDVAIEYLETGKSIYQEYEHELLDAARDDFETLCIDYGV